jgi:hypothetical protein
VGQVIGDIAKIHAETLAEPFRPPAAAHGLTSAKTLAAGLPSRVTHRPLGWDLRAHGVAGRTFSRVTSV